MKTSIKLALIAIITLWSKPTWATAIINGNYPSLKDGDKVTLTTNLYGRPNFKGITKSYQVQIKDHSFKFSIEDVTIPTRFEIEFEDSDGKLTYTNFYLKKMLVNYYLEDNDNIILKETDCGIQIMGHGSAKYQLISELKFNSSKLKTRLEVSPRKHIEWIDSLTAMNFRLLESRRSEISQNVYYLLKAGILGNWFAQTEYLTYQLTDTQRKVILDSLKNVKFKMPLKKGEILALNNSDVLAFDDIYSNSIFYKFMYDSCYLKNKPYTTTDYYHFIKDNYGGQLRQRIVTNILFNRRVYPENNSEILNDALTWVTNKDFHSILQSLKDQRTIGAEAFDFSLTDEKGEIHRMSNMKGKIIFMDFWFTGCGNCIRVRPFIEQIEQQFRGKAVIFLSINVDNTRRDWLKSVQSGLYTTKYATNLYGGKGGINSEIAKHYSVSDGPTLILIDKFGKLMAAPKDPRNDNGKNISTLINEGLQK